MPAEFEYFVWADCWVAPGSSFTVHWFVDPTKMRWFDAVINSVTPWLQGCYISRVQSYVDVYGNYSVWVTVRNTQPNVCFYSIYCAETV